MPRQTLTDSFARHREQDRAQGLFELESDRVLEVNLDGRVWMKVGAMIAYRGAMTFTREGLFNQGLGNALKKIVTFEGGWLTKAEGRGKLYLADGAKKLSILELRDESLWINGTDLLAFQDGLSHDIRLMRKISSVLHGGLFNVKVAGNGLVAVGTHGLPLALAVTPSLPVYTDPNATVAWSGGLEPELKTDLQFKTFLGRGSGESFQKVFRGEGFVLVQPYEKNLGGQR